MMEMNQLWLKKEVRDKCNIAKLQEEKNRLCETYRDVFNGAPFYENWDFESAEKVIDSYMSDGATILVANYLNKLVGFLIALNRVPSDQLSYVEHLSNTNFIEEIGVLSEIRGNKIASELVRVFLKNLDDSVKYIGYRTNAMRYFEYSDFESFESAVMRVQNEDMIKRMNNEDIIIPDFTESEKQIFINKYIELIKYRPDLDVSNSSALMRDIFGTIEYNKIDNNYTFQKDPTGDGNDRVFPYVDLQKVLRLKK